jgi:hypothetical protein
MVFRMSNLFVRIFFAWLQRQVAVNVNKEG